MSENQYISFPWPPSVLNPNEKSWKKKIRPKKKYRKDCAWIAKTTSPCTEFKLTFYPPTAHRRDIDNCIAMFKSGQDGIAEAWGIDDSNFIIHYHRELMPPVKGGKIILKKIR